MFDWFRKWKYNPKIIKHWVEIEEGGELSSATLQTEKHEETKTTDKSVNFQRLTTAPESLDNGEDSPEVESEETFSCAA